MSLIDDWLDTLFGGSKYKLRYEQCMTSSGKQVQQISDLEGRLALARQSISQLEMLVKQPAPPQIDYIVERDSAWIDAQLQAMKLNIVRLTLDNKYKLTNRKNMANIVLWDTTERLTYVRDLFDCEDFTMLFKVTTNLVFGLNQLAAILDYKSGHSYILILYPESEHMILETETDGMYLWTKRITEFYYLEGATALI
jgi:hypothetical protein